MSLKAESARTTYLLEEQVIEKVRMDAPTHMTFFFRNGPRLYVGVDSVGELDCSIVEGPDADPAWAIKADDPKGPPPVKRNKKSEK